MAPQRSYAILIVAGSEAIVEMLQRALPPEGMSLTVSASVTSAKEALAQGSYSVVLLEPTVGGEDGLALLAFMRAERRYERVPVVVIVSSVPAPTLPSGAASDVSILKAPLDPMVLARLVRLLAVTATEARS